MYACTFGKSGSIFSGISAVRNPLLLQGYREAYGRVSPHRHSCAQSFCELQLRGGRSTVLSLWSSSKFWPKSTTETHTHTSEAIERCPNCCVSCHYTTPGLCLLKVWHWNEEAGEQKGNMWRCFSGCLKTCEGTWNTQLLWLHIGTNPDVASGWAGGENRAV